MSTRFDGQKARGLTRRQMVGVAGAVVLQPFAFRSIQAGADQLSVNDLAACDFDLRQALAIARDIQQGRAQV